jgi:hypothetical protein
MRIVDCRDKNSDLVRFSDLPHFAVFESLEGDGLFIKYEVPTVKMDVRVGYAGVNLNAFRITDSTHINDRLWWKFNPDLLVRPLDVELHIKGVKQYA